MGPATEVLLPIVTVSVCAVLPMSLPIVKLEAPEATRTLDAGKVNALAKFES